MKTLKKHVSRLVTIVAPLFVLLHPAGQPIVVAGLFGDVVGGVGDLLEGGGELIGRPFGGLLGGLTGPTVQKFEDAGHRLIDDVDTRMAARVGQVDEIVSAGLQDADRMLEQRLIQVDGIAVRRLSQLDSMAEARIGQVDKSLVGRINQLDSRAAARITQVDSVLESRIGQLDGILDDSLDRVDLILSERLDQFDEIAEARIGNVDAVAAKATLNLEQSGMRLVGATCLLVFFAASVWSIYKFVYLEWQSVPESVHGLRAKLQYWWQLKGVKYKLAGSVVGVAIAIAILQAGIWVMPSGSAEAMNALVETHETSYVSSLAALDFRRSTFHAGQLCVLDPSQTRYRAYLQKASLMRDVFSRPNLRSTLSGLSDVSFRLDQVDSLMRQSGHSDPDLDVLKAFLIWESGPVRLQEYTAAVYARQAIDQMVLNASDTNTDLKQHTLSLLALNYLDNYMSNPLPDRVLQEAIIAKNKAASGDSKEIETEVVSLDQFKTSRTAGANKFMTSDMNEKFVGLSHILHFDRLSRDLFSSSMAEYTKMVAANAQLLALADTAEQDEVQRLTNIRATSAKAVVNAWVEFDSELSRQNLLAASSSSLVVFRLRDAMYSRAKWYTQLSDNRNALADEAQLSGIPPALSQSFLPIAVPSGGDAAAIAETEATNSRSIGRRLFLTPPRIVWAKRYMQSMAPLTRAAFAREFSNGFKVSESELIKFEEAMLAFSQASLVGSNGKEVIKTGKEVVVLAARLGLTWNGPEILSPGSTEDFGGSFVKLLERQIVHGSAQKDFDPELEGEFGKDRLKAFMHRSMITL